MQEEKELFLQNLDLILEFQDEILNNPRYYGCNNAFAYMSVTYLRGGPIPLGILLAMWNEKKYSMDCPD